MHIIGFRSFWLPLLIVTGLSAAVCVALSGRREGLKELKRREARLTARLERLQHKNRDLRSRRNALLTSLKEIERVAREEYGYRGQDEYVMTISTPASAESPPPVSEPTETLHRPWWARFLGGKGYPWRIPVLVAGVSFFVIPLLNALGASAPKSEAEEA